VQSAGAHKGVIVSTAPHQTGAVRFAQVHGIALATVTEGRFLYEARDALPAPQLSRAEAAARLGYPTFISNYYESGDKMGSIRVWSLLPGGDEYTRDVADLLLGAENLPRKITAQGSAVASNRRAPGRGLFVPKPTPFVVYLANVLLGLQLGVWLRPRKSGIGTARCYSVGYSSAWRASNAVQLRAPFPGFHISTDGHARDLWITSY